jgi:hypothetical protein
MGGIIYRRINVALEKKHRTFNPKKDQALVKRKLTVFAQLALRGREKFATECR